jgi:hypothetical protein
MTVVRRSALLLAVSFCLLGLGTVTGCNSTTEQIPLAKVPPPPAGFDKAWSSKVPTNASPTNANERRR